MFFYIVARPAEHQHVQTYLVQASEFYAIIQEGRTVKLYVKFSLFILLCVCDRSTHRKLIRGTSYQVPLTGTLVIDNIRTGIHSIHSMNVIVLETGGILY